jgi:hypothetical protein
LSSALYPLPPTFSFEPSALLPLPNSAFTLPNSVLCLLFSVLFHLSSGF